MKKPSCILNANQALSNWIEKLGWKEFSRQWLQASQKRLRGPGQVRSSAEAGQHVAADPTSWNQPLCAAMGWQWATLVLRNSRKEQGVNSAICHTTWKRAFVALCSFFGLVHVQMQPSESCQSIWVDASPKDTHPHQHRNKAGSCRLQPAR